MAPVLVQEAASDSKLIALFPPACPGPTALFGRAVRGRLSPRKAYPMHNKNVVYVFTYVSYQLT